MDNIFTYPPVQPDAEALKARITALEFDNQALRENSASIIKNLADENAELEAQIAAQAGQEDILAKVWIHCFPDGDYDIRDSASFPDRAPRDATRYPDKEVPCPGCVGAVIIKRDWLNASPPAPANSLAIVQAALEAACTAVWETEHDDRQKVLDDIRAIDKQAIISAVTKGQS